MKKIVALIFAFMFSMGFYNSGILAKSFDTSQSMDNEESVENQGFNNKGALKNVIQITNEIEKRYGSLEKFEKIGGLYFDSEGILHLNYKVGNGRNLEDTSTVQMITDIVSKENIEVELVEYSVADLEEIKEKILIDIQEAYSEEEYNKLAFVVMISFENQKVILEHRDLKNTLISQIKANFGDVFEEKFTDSTPKITKAREADWNQLGAGLGIKN